MKKAIMMNVMNGHVVWHGKQSHTWSQWNYTIELFTNFKSLLL